MNCQKDIFLAVLLWRQSLSLWDGVSSLLHSESDLWLWWWWWRWQVIVILEVRWWWWSRCFLFCENREEKVSPSFNIVSQIYFQVIVLLEVHFAWNCLIASIAFQILKRRTLLQNLYLPVRSRSSPSFLLHSLPDLLLRPNHCNFLVNIYYAKDTKKTDVKTWIESI